MAKTNSAATYPHTINKFSSEYTIVVHTLLTVTYLIVGCGWYTFIYIYMYIKPVQKRIALAILFSCIVVASALIVRAKTTPISHMSQTGPAVVAAAHIHQPLPVTDSNGDGVPDWQEALQTTKPLILASSSNSVDMGTSTLTGKFSRQLLQQLVESKMSGGFGKNSQQIASSTASQLVQAAGTDPLITKKDIIISNDTSSSSLAAYGAAVATIMISNSSTTAENEAIIFGKAVKDQNAAELKPLDAKITAYENMFNATKKLSVPAPLVQQQLDLLDSYQAILIDIKAMRNGLNDPMNALVRIKRYQNDATGLYNSIVAIYSKLIASGTTWPQGSPVYSLIRLQPGQNQ